MLSMKQPALDATDDYEQIEVAFLVVSWIAVVLRVYVRTCVVKAFGWDDRWMLFAQLMHTTNVICATGGALTGTGRLTKELTPESMMMALRVCEPQ